VKKLVLVVLGLAALTAGSAMGQLPPATNPERGTMPFWKDVKFTPDTTDPAGKRGKWSGWFHQDNVDVAKLASGVVRARLGGTWQDLKVVQLPEDFLKWNFDGRLQMLGIIKQGGMPPIHGPHDGIVASHGMKRQDSDFDINNAVKGIGWLPRPEKLGEMIALFRATWNDSMEQKVARLESLYARGREVFDLTKQSSLELYAQPNFETHTFLNQMVDPGVALVFLDLPKSYELRCIAQMLHPDDPGLSSYERQVVEYINLVHDYFHGRAPRTSIGVIYHVVQVFDNSPGMGRGRRTVPSLP
jgi:hypothetical protein